MYEEGNTKDTEIIISQPLIGVGTKFKKHYTSYCNVYEFGLLFSLLTMVILMIIYEITYANYFKLQ